jgi:hypothetical protein
LQPAAPLLYDNLVHGIAGAFKNDEFMVDAMALQSLVSSQKPSFFTYNVQFIELTLCIDSGHNSSNW